jgi:hypothetical protein
LPIQIGFNAPIETKHGHENDCDDPKDSSKSCLIREEDVDESHDGRVFRVVNQDFVTGFEWSLLFVILFTLLIFYPS